jgi:hypothetical protein
MKKTGFLNLFMIILMLLVASGVVFAQEGEGGGENKDEPIVLVTSSITNNQINVPVDSEIRFEFNKNVVNMKVAENNKKCISLIDEKQTQVPISVQMGDDQVDPAIKRIITLVPKEPLKEGSSYIVLIKEGFMAKNGTTLTAPITLAFTTAGTQSSQPNSTLKKATAEEISKSAVQNSENAEVKDTLTMNSSFQEVDDNLENAKIREESSKGNLTLYQFSGGCILAALILIIVYILRRRNS